MLWFFMDNEHFTGEKNKRLLVHVMQNSVEVAKPIKTQIWKQEVTWNQRVFPIDHNSFILDSKGIHHQYVEANDLAVLRFNKDHEDKCRKCGGKMFIDARNARDLVKRKTIEAIWGIDSTHIILLMLLGIAVLGAVGAVMYVINLNTQLQAKINSAIATNDLSPLTAKFLIPMVIHND
jgi:hypothetical protein